VFGNRMQRRIFGTKRKAIPEIWKKLYNKELHNF
jgi:hypothetical protein